LLRIPEDIEAQFANKAIRSPEACIIRYEALQTVLSAPALVTWPTFVFVCSGVKQLKPQDGQHILTAPTGSVLAMRSGTHVMSEFHGEDAGYQSLILSVNRAFLREAIGIPKVADDGPRVVVSSPSAYAQRLFQVMPSALAQRLPDIERQFKLRELLVALMVDQEVHRLLLREAADWGSTDEERLVSIVTTHCLSPLQVPDFARLCAMSLSSFKRRFQNIYGTSPARWLNRLRLEHARSMVLNSDLPVSEICQASGYRDVSNFIRAFCRNFGITPAALRHGR
jgi:AraC-like DNA-binding protein